MLRNSVANSAPDDPERRVMTHAQNARRDAPNEHASDGRGPKLSEFNRPKRCLCLREPAKKQRLFQRHQRLLSRRWHPFIPRFAITYGVCRRWRRMTVWCTNASLTGHVIGDGPPSSSTLRNVLGIRDVSTVPHTQSSRSGHQHG